MGTPILAAFPRDDDPQLTKVWCPRCRVFHLHGIVGDSGYGIEHRIAHCSYHDDAKIMPWVNGYFVWLGNPFSEAEANLAGGPIGWVM